MRWRKLLIGGIVGVAAVSGILLPFPGIAQAQAIRWERIIGLQQAFDLVGVGNGQVVGGAPWETTNGEARVNLTNGQLRFTVHGLILAVGSAGDGALIGLPIGTTAGVT